ncbi:dTDP-4-dehydrorhamnose 3,5-epimerase [Lachnospiraceae bacterium YSD2013]|nr:dTDP-4-dehydrorhamnose 3,5-epimerase [Lachnospiraceae bacterium YSD2013]
MEIVKSIFEEAKLIKTVSRTDNRGPMRVIGNDERQRALGINFMPHETRTYTMPRTGTFFGIHFQPTERPGAKLISLITGRGTDFIIDLRPDSPTYLKWEAIELSADNDLMTYVPTGFGHAFLSTSDDVIMLYQTDFHGGKGYTGRLNYKESSIGLKLPTPVAEIADYDAEAPFLNDI